MIKKIGIDQLKPGMYVHDLNCGWLDHPFLKNSFAVDKEQTIEKIRAIGVRELYIDTKKGGDVSEARTQQEVSEELDRRMRELVENQGSAGLSASVSEESARARRMHGEANRIVRGMMEDVRMGAQIEIERVEPMVESMVDSIFRNQDALLPLARLKNHDNYTFQHSVSVCALLVAFSRSAKLPRETIREIGMGALLHDVGKAKLPDAILNKPGKLTDEEFDLVRTHVRQGVDILRASARISDTALCVVGEHHERFDGSGYPGRKNGGDISVYGQMAAIVDVYDAISSERVYHKGIPPTLALKRLLEWSEHHFNPALVQSFIRTVGIYPTGALVRLESGRLGVVIEQNERSLLEPVVRVFYRADKHYYIPPEVVDLAKTQDRVASFEAYEKWNIDPYAWLPG
ncbi:MAG: HD-GYP domain-containing protein [Betaproteobacteria bacterium]